MSKVYDHLFNPYTNIQMKRIPKSVKYLQQSEFIKLFEEFIKASYKGHRTKKNGEKIRTQTVDNYTYALKLLLEFSQKKQFEIKLFLANHLSPSELVKAKKYWQKFYQEFTDYLYDDLGHYDNYVGATIKQLRVFMNYLNAEIMLNVGEFHKSFHVPKEEIQIVVFTPEQLNYLIHDDKFNQQLLEEQKVIRDIFVFGCLVALRYSDLMGLRPLHLLNQENGTYLVVKSQKTGSESMVKLPEQALQIVKKYSSKKGKYLFPRISKSHFNRQLKILAVNVKQIELIKYRYRRKRPIPVFKDPMKKEHYQLADHITSHTMRRTAITTLLRLGMPEQTVRKISGHAANSTEFYKYIAYNQTYLDAETDKVFNKLSELKRQ